MNPIELLINEHNEKLHPGVCELVESLGLPNQNVNQGALRNLSRNKQLLLVAEYHQFIQIRDCLALIAPLDPATWPQQFDALAKAQWELTLGTALEYFENPTSLGYSLLAAAASVIFPSLTTVQRMDKLVRGGDWGIQGWVILNLVNVQRVSHKLRRMNCHAELVIEPCTGLTSLQGVVTDGTRALDIADLLESYAAHLPHPLAQQLLKEFISELKQQYPTLYVALRNYNTETRGLLSYLDQSQTPREALEELRRVFFADAKLLTGNMYATERSHQATAVFSAYLQSLVPEEREALCKLKSSHITLNDIVNGIDQGMCVELAAGEITKFLHDPTIATTLDRVPQRMDATSATTPAWVMTDADLLLQRGMLQHEIPLNLLQSVLKHLRTRVGNHSGLWLASLMNLISPREQEQLIHKVLNNLSTRSILNFFMTMQLPKQIIILEAIDKWKTGNPFLKICEFAKLVFAFSGTKSELLNHLPNTLVHMEWSLKDLFEIMKRGLEVEIKVILQPVTNRVFYQLMITLDTKTPTEEYDLLFARENALVTWRLILLLPRQNTAELIKAFIMPLLSTGQLGIIMASLDENALINFFRIANTSDAWNKKIRSEFGEFAYRLMRHLSPEAQKTICELLHTHSKKALLEVIDNTDDLSNLCFSLEKQELYAAASLIWALIEETFLDKINFKKYARKLNESDFHYLADHNEAAITSLILEDSGCLAVAIEKLPLSMATSIWHKVSTQDGIKEGLELSTINRLFVILPLEEFERLFEELTENILKSFSHFETRHLAQFACHALRHKQALSLWLILNKAAIGTNLERMHNLLIMLSFLSKYTGHSSLPDDEQLIKEYQFMHRGACYSNYFDLLREQGNGGTAAQLREQLAKQIHTIKDFKYVQKRCNATDSEAILSQCLTEFTSQSVGAGDFAKLVGDAQPETIQHVWHRLQHLPMLSIVNLIDLKVLALAFPTESLRAICELLQGRVAQMVHDVISFHFLLMNLPDDKQQILLEWALDVLRPMIIRPMQQTHLLLNLSPAMQVKWRPSLPIYTSAQRQQGLFREPKSVTMTLGMTTNLSHSK